MSARLVAQRLSERLKQSVVIENVAGGMADIAAEAGVEVEEERVVDPKVLELASLLERLDRGDPEFVSVVSEVRPAEDGGYEFRMLPDADAGRVFLPEHDPLRALRRISLALGRIEDPRVRTADARFEDRVILTREAGR